MKHEIDIPGLPDGLRAVSYRPPLKGELYFHHGKIEQAPVNLELDAIIIEKNLFRRIVLEETMEERYLRKGDWFYYRGCLRRWSHSNECNAKHRIWRVIEET